MKKKLLSLPNFLFIFLIFALFTPNVRETDSPIVLILVIIGIEVIYIAYMIKNDVFRQGKNIVTVLFVLFLIWQLATSKFNLVNQVLFPAPENVFYVFVTQWKLILTGILSSLRLLALGFFYSLAFGISLGLIVGWIPVLRETIYPIAKVLSPIPPIVYTPYVIALMPTFSSASILVIFLGIFWPTFMNMINGVSAIDKNIIDSARSMNVSTPTMLFKIILPYSLPGIMDGLTISVSFSFMILTAAEMIGATSGLGYFVQKFAAYSDYTKELTGIIVIGVVVAAINYLLRVVRKLVIKWKPLV